MFRDLGRVEPAERPKAVNSFEIKVLAGEIS